VRGRQCATSYTEYLIWHIFAIPDARVALASTRRIDAAGNDGRPTVARRRGARARTAPTFVTETSDAGPLREDSPTLTLEAATRASTILGTAAYMSPEQATGKTADRRSDIWSFGAVLFEMLTGKRAFEGESISETLANVLKVEPDWNALPAAFHSKPGASLPHQGPKAAIASNR
jgi:serine/threonine protein kinase